MAATATSRRPLLPLTLTLGAYAVLVAAERALDGLGIWRILAWVVCLSALAGAVVLRWRRHRAAPEALRPATRTAWRLQLAALLPLVLYVLVLPAVRGALGVQPPSDPAQPDTYGTVLLVASLLSWALTAIPLFVVDLAARPMLRAGIADVRRLGAAFRSSLSVSMAISALFLFDYAATRHDVVADLAYFRAARPGKATRKVVRKLGTPIDVYLFFPRANEVLDEVRSYFETLRRDAGDDLLRIHEVDRLEHPKLAGKFHVAEDGTVVLARGDAQEKWKIGTKLDRARLGLKRFDAEVYHHLVRLAGPPHIAYLVRGHGELSDTRRPDGSVGPRRDRIVRRALETLGFEVKFLSLREGLGSGVPEDAGVVLLLGPQTALLPEEVGALKRYVERGGRLLVAVDPDGDARATKLLDALGVVVHHSVVLHDRLHLQRTFSKADRQIVVLPSFTSHPAVRTLSKNAGRVALVADRAGWIERKTEGVPEGTRVVYLVRTDPAAWADVNGDFEFNEGKEKKKAYAVVAAVTRRVDEANKDADKGKSADRDGGKSDAEQARAIVASDADMFGDELMRNQANVIALAEMLRWLEGREDLGAVVETEEDVPIEHTRDEDVAWFYGTVFAIPLLVLGGGLGYVRAFRRKRRKG